MAEETIVTETVKPSKGKGATARAAEARAATEVLIVDLGKRSKRDVDRLRKGRGDLMDEVDDCLQELTSAGQISESAQPVVIVVRETLAGRMRSMMLPPGIPFAFPFGMPEEDDEDEEDDNDEDDED
jgi:hypothetical protein